MKIFLTILRYFLFCSLLLILGQLPIGRETLGAQYIVLIKKSWNWSSDQIMHTKAYESVAAWPVFSLILKPPIKEASRGQHQAKASPVAPAHLALARQDAAVAGTGEADDNFDSESEIPVGSQPEIKASANDIESPEHITASDRESLLRLLK